jgi:16S rRNA (adenine(1408)-N(1))-methyltransferase
MIDLGAGDGRAVLATAAAEPSTLVIGVDAAAASMAESSRRAARAGRATRGAPSNVLFVVAAAEAIPSELVGIAERVRVQLPWGSLLRGCLGLDNRVAAGIASLVAPGGELKLLLAPIERDGLAAVPTDPGEVIRAVAAAFAAFGLVLAEGRPATAEELGASHSTWAKRLLSAGSAASRPVTLVRLRSSPR